MLLKPRFLRWGGPSSDESLAKAFHVQCHINSNTPDWHVDSGATDHMTPACDPLHHSSLYPGNAKVMFWKCYQLGLYVLKDEPTAFIATAKVIKPASYELWHARLGHVSFDVISTLNKLGVLSITSLLPKPILCTPCQLAKGQRLPFTINAKRSSHPLDLIHCDLWGPAPICSKDGYRYYVAFIDDYS
ncbi:retrovirus-related pol polyprotein from transposon TNT 1-94, partial [Tanacetum coccineum]